MILKESSNIWKNDISRIINIIKLIDLLDSMNQIIEVFEMIDFMNYDVNISSEKKDIDIIKWNI